MKLELVEDLYARELSEALLAEKRTLQAMPKFLKVVRNEDLRELVERHTKETEQQINELEKLVKKFESDQNQNRGTVIDALLAEAEAILSMQADPDIQHVALIFVAQKIESNEIACYSGLETMARLLTLNQDADVLARILGQEKKMSDGLFAVADALESEAVEAERTE